MSKCKSTVLLALIKKKNHKLIRHHRVNVRVRLLPKKLGLGSMTTRISSSESALASVFFFSWAAAAAVIVVPNVNIGRLDVRPPQ